MRMNLHTAERLKKIFFTILLIITALLSVFPFYWMILNSLKNPAIIFKTPVDLITFDLTAASYKAVFGYENGIIWRAYANSLFIAVTSTFGTLFTSSLAAFAFAKLKFRGKNVIYSIFIATLMIPGQVTLLPLYVVFAKIGWVPSFLPLIIPGCLINTYGVFMLRSFIVSIPDDLLAAAKVDGCGILRQYFHVILPLCKPALITLGLFSFIGSWNNYFGQFIYLSGDNMVTIPLLIASLKEANMTGVEWGRVMAASTLSIIPFAAVYLSCQKYFVQGIATTGLK